MYCIVLIAAADSVTAEPYAQVSAYLDGAAAGAVAQYNIAHQRYTIPDEAINVYTYKQLQKFVKDNPYWDLHVLTLNS